VRNGSQPSPARRLLELASLRSSVVGFVFFVPGRCGLVGCGGGTGVGGSFSFFSCVFLFVCGVGAWDGGGGGSFVGCCFGLLRGDKGGGGCVLGSALFFLFFVSAFWWCFFFWAFFLLGCLGVLF